MKKYLLILLMLLFSVPSLYSETNQMEINKNQLSPIERYDAFSLKYFYNLWRGNGFTREFDNKKFNLSSFGMDKELLQILMNSPSSAPYMVHYKRDLALGHLFYWTGIALIFADAFMLSSDSGFVYNTNLGQGLYWGFLAGGLTGVFAGADLMIKAYHNSMQAIWAYNRDVVANEAKLSSIQEPRMNLAFNFRF